MTLTGVLSCNVILPDVLFPLPYNGLQGLGDEKPALTVVED